MKSRHVVCLFSVLMFAIVLIGLAAAQSSHSVPAKKLAGPFAAAVMDRFGVRRTMTIALTLTAGAAAL